MYECDKCEKKCKNPQALQMHKNWKHPEGASPVDPVAPIPKNPNNDFDFKQNKGEVTPMEPKKSPKEVAAPVPAPESKEVDTIECGKCGAEIKEGQEYCLKCGEKLDWEAE